MNRIVARLTFAALAIAAIAAPMSAQTAPPERWIVPVVGSTAGANGAQFRTSMQMHNPSEAPAAGAIVFHPMGTPGSGVDPAIRYALAPYETLEFADVVAALGQTGLGSLDVVADSGTVLPTMTVRAFNILPTLGTLGSSVPVVHPDDALARGDAVIVVSPANIQRYRLNIGIRTLEGPVVVRATIFNEAGAQRGESFERTFATEYFEQRAAADFLGVPLQANDSVIFEVISGRAFIYGSTTDNRTNDPNIQIDRLFGRSILADSQTVTTPEDTPVTITLTGEIQGNVAPVFSITRAPMHGTLSAFRVGSDTTEVVYTPNPDYHGPDDFEFQISDGRNRSARATVTINVTPVNDPPVAQATAVTTDEDQPVVITLTGSDPDGDPLTFGIVSSPANGTLGSITQVDTTSAIVVYTPNPDVSGADEFTFVVNDGAVTSAAATVTIDVLPANDVPAAAADLYATLEDTPLVIAAPGVLTNDSDPDGDALTAILASAPATGTLTFDANGGFTYTPAANANGVVTFSYRVNDGTVDSDPVIVTINVTAVNDPPSFTRGADATVPEDAGAQTLPWATAIGAGPADEASQTLSFTVTGNTNAALFAVPPAVSSDGTLTFTSAPDANGSATITLVLGDNGGTANGGVDTTAPQTFTITVTPVNDPPFFTKGADATVLEDSGAQTIDPWATAIGAGPADESAQTLAFAVTGNSNAALFLVQPAISPSGVLTFTPAADASGSATITIALADDGGTANGGVDISAAQTFVITVTEVNDPPSFTKGADASTLEDAGPQTINGWATAISAGPAAEAGQVVSFNVVSNSNPALFSTQPSISPAGVLTFTTATNAFGTATITIGAQDDGGTANGGIDTSATQSFVIDVTPVNDVPSATITPLHEVDEDSGPHAVANYVSAISPGPANESGQMVTFSIIGNTNPGLFASGPAIDAAGTLTYSLNPDAFGTAAITVQLTDDGGTADGGIDTATINFTIEVAAVNDAPVVTAGGPFTLAENSANGTLFGATIAATDVDPGQTISFAITAGNTGGAFAINAATGEITVANSAALDFETTPAFSLTITATDDGVPPLFNSEIFVVNLTNVAEAPTEITLVGSSVDENAVGAAIGTLATTDPDAGDTHTYAVNDARFTATGGNLALAAGISLDFETEPTVSIEITTTDSGALSFTRTFVITVNDINEAPGFTSPAAASVPENTTAVLTVTASDPEGDTITYSITGGVDAAFFSIDGATGALAFLAGPDFEAPADADANNVYLVDVTATDGTNPVVQSLAVTVTDANEAPLFTSSPTPSTPENTTAVLTVTTTDAEGDTVTYSITGGADAALFSINPATGALAFNAAPDFEAPADADTNNQYLVEVTATDGTTPVAQMITVTVTNVNEAPAITSTAAIGVPENTTAVITVTTTDPEGDTITYSISGGVDAAFFTIDGATGALAFLVAPDFETPLDAGADNVYDVQVQASDGTNNVTQDIAVTVAGTNEPPVITSPDSASVPENTTAVMTVTATEPEGQLVSYSITGGADAALFSIVAGTGVLTFNAAPDFEAPADFDTNNVYLVEITVTDGTTPVPQTITVTVTDVNEAPSFTSSATPSVPENSTAVMTVVATDPEGGVVTYSISGGVDAALFSIDASTGMLVFNAAPNFEAPADAGANNVYDIIVTAGDGTNSPTQAIAITVTNVNEGPTITSPATVSVPENTTSVLTVTTTDVEGDTITYSVTGGADMALFTINSATGALSFLVAPDFEAPTDAGGNNVYDVQVQATDGTTPVTQNLVVTVTNQNEAPSFTSSASLSVPENTTAVVDVDATDPEGIAPTYAITGGADALLFTINGTSGVLSFVAAPDFESPADADTNNVYLVEVTATDGVNPVVQSLSVTVTNVNEAPSFTSSGTPSVPENSTSVTTVAATDAEGETITYSISGGADAADFSINSSTGALVFTAAPNFEAPHDADTNNVYLVQVTATDGTSPVTQNLTVTVTDVNEPPAFTSAATASIPENATAAATVTAVDPDAGATVTYSVSGGADMALFTIDGGTGVLSFVTAPDFEAPADAGANNVYDVIVTAGDGTNNPTQAIAITVTNVDEAPVFTSAATHNVPENTTSVVTVTTTEPEGDTVTYSISGGADAALFSIDGSTGALTFNSAPNFEAPTDAGANNIYDVQVQATDGTTPVTQNIVVTVTNVNEAPTAVADSATTDEDTTLTVAAPGVLANDTDPDSGDTKSVVRLNGSLILTGTSAKGATVTINANGSYTYNPGVIFNGLSTGESDTDTFTYTMEDAGGLQSTATVNLTIEGVSDVPVAAPDSFDVIGNTGLFVGTAVPAGQAGKVIAGSVLANDTDPDTPQSALVAEPVTALTTGGGIITIASNGSFIYHPKAGYTGVTDTFTYRVCDATPCSSTTVANATGQLNLVIAGEVWYVRNNAVLGGDGTSDGPFVTIAEAETAAGVGDTVYVFDGDNTTTRLNTGFAMKANQRLVGEAAALTIDPDGLGPLGTETLFAGTSGAYPTLSATGKDVVVLASGALVEGINVDPAGSGGGIYGGTGTSGVTIRNVNINDTGTFGSQPGLELDGTSGTHSISDLTVTTSGATGVRLNNAGAVNFTPASTISIVTNGAKGLDATGTNMGTSTFDGITVTNSGSGGLSMTNTTGTTTFEALSLTTTSGVTAAFFLSNAGSISVPAAGTANVSATGGRAIDVTGTNMGTSTFDGITVTNSGTGGVSMTNTTGTTTFESLSLTTTSGATAAFFLSNAGTISVPAAGTANVSATGGPAIDVTGTAGATLAFDNVSSTNSANDGINIAGLGAGTFSATGGTISGAAGIAFDIDGGSGAVTYAGALNNGAGQTAEITGRTGGVVTLSGAIADSSDQGGGISVTGNTGGATVFSNASKVLSTGTGDAITFGTSPGHTLTFSGGGLDIDTTSGKGLAATASGTIIVTGTGNTITTSTGTALNISTTSIGADGVTFHSIAANGATNGIILNGTGDNAFRVTGDGSLGRNGSGGTIENTTGDAIQLTNANNVTLQSMNLVRNGSNPVSAAAAAGSSGNHTIDISGGSNVVLSGVHFDGPKGSGLVAVNLNGTNRLDSNTRFENTLAGAGHSIYVNNTNTNMTLFELNNVQMANNAATHTNFFFANTGTSNMALTVQNNCVFEDLGTQAITVAAGGTAATTGTLTSTIQNSTFRNAKGLGENNIGILVGNGAIHTATVSNNLLDNIAKEGTIANTSILRTQNSGGVMNATVSGNTIRNISYAAGNGGRHVFGHVFEPFAYSAGYTSNLTFTNNTITNVTFTATNREAFFVDFRPTAAGGKVTIQGNSVNMPSAGTQQAIELRFRQTNPSTVQALVRGNAITHNTEVNFLDVDAEDGAILQLTVDGANNFTNTNPTPGRTIAVATEDAPAIPGGPSSMCANITGNTLQSGTGTISIDKTFGTTLTVPQNNANQIASANGIPNANVSTSGSPTFNQPACTVPTP